MDILIVFYVMSGLFYNLSLIEKYNDSFIIKIKKSKNRINKAFKILFLPMMPFMIFIFYILFFIAYVIFYPLGELMEFLEIHKVKYNIKKRIIDTKLYKFLFDER